MSAAGRHGLNRGRAAFLLLCLALSGCGRRAALERALLADDSATAVLERWCRDRALASPPVIVAARLSDNELPATAAIRALLAVSPDEPVRYRHVHLRCGAHVLSIAHNWYVPSRLDPAMNTTLDGSDVPFGRVVQPLAFTRRRLTSERTDPICPADSILAQRATLTLPDGRPISTIVECYTPELFARH